MNKDEAFLTPFMILKCPDEPKVVVYNSFSSIFPSPVLCHPYLYLRYSFNKTNNGTHARHKNLHTP